MIPDTATASHPILDRRGVVTPLTCSILCPDMPARSTAGGDTAAPSNRGMLTLPRRVR
jgi:hypothetical protein